MFSLINTSQLLIFMILLKKVYQKYYYKLWFGIGSSQQQAVYSFLVILFGHIQSYPNCAKAYFPQM